LKKDPYIISEATIKEAPTSFLQSLKFLGPGFILSASIVGSGELIATTVLGGKAGFTVLWIIILSCLTKVAVQLEFGKHAILTGETAMHAFNRLPGPKFGAGKWSVWLVFVAAVLKIVQVGGILGGAVVVLSMLFPGLSIFAWTLVTALSVSALIYNGKYGVVEKLSLIMILMFTVLTLTSLFAIQFTEYRFSFGDVIGGLAFKLPGEVVALAIGAFGITGVASDEIIAYNYWCIEKGYAAYTGPPQENDAWKNRASGWIKVMYLDASVAMLIYTSVTIAFYLLGAAILHHHATIPEGNQVIETLALIYTQSLGSGVKIAYLVGAFFVLYSSLFASLAAWTRLFSDIFGQMGWIDFFDFRMRNKVIAVLSWIFPACWGMAYLFIKLPVVMVLSGGIVGSFLLLVVVFAAIHFKYRRGSHLQPGIAYNTAFWISVVSIAGIGVYGAMRVML
jgi:manganese transport protein